MHRALRTAVAIVVSVAFGSAALVSARGRQLGPQSFFARVEIPAGGSSVPLQDFSGRPAVDVFINGRGPFPFVIGTGTVTTSIGQDLIEQLGLDPAADPVSGPLTVGEMRVGDVVLRGMTVGRAVAVSNATEDVPRGVLSASVFAGQLLVLDYPGGRLRVLPGELPAADGRRIFDYAPDDPLPSVPVSIGDRSFSVRVDSIAPGALTLPTRAAVDLPLADVPIVIGHLATAYGDFPVSVATVNGLIAIGEQTLDIHAVTFSDVRAGVPSGIGSIGARILESFIVTIDGRNHRVRLDRSGTF